MAKTVRADRKRSSLKKRRGLIGKKSKVARRAGSRRRVKVMRGGAQIELANFNVLIIDPQVDFHELGRLAIKGANDDSTRIAKFIETQKDKINKVFVSLDTHTNNHIGHPGYWTVLNDDKTVAKDQTIPAFTFFGIKGDYIIGTTHENNDPGTAPLTTKYFTPKNFILLGWTKKYIKDMREKHIEKGIPLIWPTHCLENEPGHKVSPLLKLTLDKLDPDGVTLEKAKVEYHIKGQNEATEMYSIFKAEIPFESDFEKITSANTMFYSDGKFKTSLKKSSKIEKTKSDVPDGAYLQTSFNQELYKSLTKDGKPIVVCGEALSHCVNWSLRDLVTKIIEDNNAAYVENGKLKPNMVILLANASTTIQNFESNTTKLLEEFCPTTGVTVLYLDAGNLVDTKPPEPTTTEST